MADSFLNEFYDEQFSHGDFAEIVARAGSNRARLQDFQRMYLLQLFDGIPDATYVESRLRIGALHALIGVTPRWYVSSYRLYEKLLFPRLRQHFFFRRRRGRRAVASLSKLLNFDKALVLDMYIEGVTDELRTASIGIGLEAAGGQAHGLLSRMAEFAAHPIARH